MNNLLENSPAYREKSDIYKIFTEAEDKPDIIFKNICRFLDNVLVSYTHDTFNLLDLGCGNGKYLTKIGLYLSQNYSHITFYFYGVDKSLSQLQQNNYIHYSNIRCCFLVSDATHDLPFRDNQFDFILSSWVLGTIIEADRQLRALEKIKKILKKEATVLLIENDVGGEFEILRGRTQDSRTKNYNDWLEHHGFVIYQYINTYFEFGSVDIAQNTFFHIWSNRLTQKIENKKIEHRVIIYKWQKCL